MVLDALNHSCHCLIPMTSQIATESPGIHTGILSNSTGLQQSGIQSCSGNSGATASSFWQTCGGCSAAAASASGLETCVDDSLCAEDLMVSSWNGLSGVPGLGVSVPSRPGKKLRNFLICHNA